MNRPKMNRAELFSQRIDIAYELFCATAAAGKISPTNPEIADLCGYNRTSGGGGGVASLVCAMIKSGMIEINYPTPNSRIVTIVATGESTARPARPIQNSVRRSAGIGSNNSKKFDNRGAKSKPPITLYTLNSEEMREAVR